MSNKVEPPKEVVDFFRSVGFQLHVITDSIYRDKRDVPLYYFQTDSKFHTQDCSTIVADDAVKIFEVVK